MVSSSDSGVEQEVAGGTTGKDEDIPNLPDPDLHEGGHDVLDGESDEDCDNDPDYNFDCRWIERYTEPLLEPSDERMLVLPDLALELESKNIELVLVDSGSFAHVCPISFGADYPIRPPMKELNMRTASGQKIKHLGTRQITFRDGAGGTFNIDFDVCCGIRRVILSVGVLRDQGVFTYFDELPRVQIHEQRISLK